MVQPRLERVNLGVNTENGSEGTTSAPAGRREQPPGPPVSPGVASNGLAWQAKALSVVFFAGGGVVTAWAVADAVNRTTLPVRDWAIVAFVGVAITTTWLLPLVIYRGDQSAAAQMDEGFLVVLLLLVPAPATVLTFAAATTFAQAFRRRSLVKSAFNFGQLVVCVGAAVLVSRSLAPPTRALTGPELGAALLGAVVFVAANTGAVTAVLMATGVPWRTALLGGHSIHLRLFGAGITAGLLAALAISAYWWALFVTVVLLFIVRQVLVAHARAHHDRLRLTGLLEATVDAHRHMRDDDVIESLSRSARDLLRCSEVYIGADDPTQGQLGAPMVVNGAPTWIVVAGRSRAEPFDSADKALVEALAAVGSAALSNAASHRQVRRERERLSAITSSLAEGVVALDETETITFMNPAATRLLGWGGFAPSNVPDDNVSDVPVPEFLAGPARRAMRTGELCQSDNTTFVTRDGTNRAVALVASPVAGDNDSVGAVVAFWDIAERLAFEDELSHLAFHDALTGLANRRLFLEHLDHALRRAERTNEIHAVLFADIDRFKIINDSLGHSNGDRVLLVLANRMRGTIRAHDMLARFGGDEFTFLLENTGVDQALESARRLQAVLQEPIVLDDGLEVVATVSIGIASTEAAKGSDDILRDADVAMYHAKAKGRGGHCQVFDQAAMGSRSAQRLDLEADLRKALERHELEIYYQPLFDLGRGEVVGAEALVRWNHPRRGQLSPAQFIDIAEETGLIRPLGRYVMQDACLRSRQLTDSLGVDFRINVNLSPRQFEQRGLVDEISDTLSSGGVSPRVICLEITETAVTHDLEQATTVLRDLKDLGVRLSIDDFGTGYSSLGYLKHFPIQEVKIDRTFVAGLGANPVDSAIVAAVINLSAALGITTVAEGVETADQLTQLHALGCAVAQGFYFSRPLAFEAFMLMLSSSRA